MHDAPQSPSGPRTQPARFLEHMHHLFGDEPDPILIQESWMVGVPAAMERHHLRRSQREAFFNQRPAVSPDPAVSELERIAGLVDERPAAARPAIHVEAFLEDRAQPIDSRYTPAWLSRIAAEPEPHDYTAGEEEDHAVAAASSKAAIHAADRLGVSHHATREDIRSAYRRKVSECHPDRCQQAPDTVRRHATQQLAEINEAYRILCADLVHHAA